MVVERTAFSQWNCHYVPLSHILLLGGFGDVASHNAAYSNVNDDGAGAEELWAFHSLTMHSPTEALVSSGYFGYWDTSLFNMNGIWRHVGFPDSHQIATNYPTLKVMNARVNWYSVMVLLRTG